MAYLPPSNTIAPKEDWDDGDFDLPNDQPFHTTPSRQTSFASTRGTTQLSSRPAFPRDPFEEDDLEGFDDEDDGFDARQSTFKLKVNSAHLPSMPVPNGKLSASSKAGFISLDTMKAMQASGSLAGPGTGHKDVHRFADAEGDEDDFADDFESCQGTLKLKPNTAGLPLKLVRPQAEKDTDWDEFDAMMEEDERQDTLKAGAGTLKGLRERYGPVQPLGDRSNIGKSTTQAPRKVSEEADLEADFAIPLTLEHLILANKKEYPSIGLRNRSSRSSLITNSSRSDWDKDIGDPHRSSFASPNTSSTSITSASMPVTDQSESDIFSKSVKVADEDDGFENDFVLPTTSFFSTGRNRELNSLLDRKRKAPPPESNHHKHADQSKNAGVPEAGSTRASRLTRATISSAAKSRYDAHEEAFEDGLVLEEEGAELNQGRLSRLRKARLPPATPVKGNAGTLRKDSGGSRGRFDSGDLFRERKTSGKIESPEGKSRKTDSGRVIVDAISSSATNGPSTPHRLRTQKSHSRLADKPTMSSGPALAKKQSLASLREAMAQSNGDHPSAPSYIAPTASSVARQAAKSKERFSEAASQPMPPMPRTPSDQSQRLRQTVPVSASKGKSRPALGSAFARPSSSASNPSHSGQYTIPSNLTPSHMTIAQVLKKPKTVRTYGDGTELDLFDDLVVDRTKEKSGSLPRSGLTSQTHNTSYISGLPNGVNVSTGLSLGRPSDHDCKSKRELLWIAPNLLHLLHRSATLTKSKSVSQFSTGEKRKKPTGSAFNASTVPPPATPARKERRKAGLIRHLGKLEKKQGQSQNKQDASLGDGLTPTLACCRSVGEMTWNPQSLRWEGNYGVLREFDNQLASSVRPALIAYRAPNGHKPVSPIDKGNVSTASTAVRVVGNMMFDAEKMCWISTLPQDEEDPDPFAGLADDEDDAFWKDRKAGGTLTKGMFSGLELREPSGRLGHEAYGRRFISDVSTAYTATPSAISRSQTSDASDDHFDAEAKVDLRHGRNLLSGKSHPSSNMGDRSISLASSRAHHSTDYELSGWTWVDEELYRETRAADRRHAQEMRQWFGSSEAERMRGRDVEKEADRAKRREEKRLWEIRHLVMDG